MKIEERIAGLGIVVPEKSSPKAMYVPCVRTGSLIFVSGQIPAKADGTLITGRLGDGMTVEEGQEAARTCAVNILSVLRSELGDLDRVVRIVKLQAFVNSTADFDKQHLVANGASQLLYDVFGEAGRHARTAVGVNVLPMNAAVEVEAIVEVE